jgi:hypothetical protein
MKIRLIKRYKLQHLYKEKGTILDVVTSYGEELIEKGVAEDILNPVKIEVVKKSIKKDLNLEIEINNNNDSLES